MDPELRIDTEIVALRFSSTVRYLSHLERIQTAAQWDAEYMGFLAGDASIEVSLALAHPKHLAGYHSVRFVRGDRDFKERASAEWSGCQSERVWGYVCPLDSVAFEADHLFPYQAGGPTSAENRIWLCTAHNRVKASDVHLYPWEEGVPSWLNERLALVSAHIDRDD